MNWWRWLVVAVVFVLAGMGMADTTSREDRKGFYAGAAALLCVLIIVGPAKERRE